MEEIYSSLKIFQFPEKLDDLKEGRVTPPLHIRLKPTNKCNHSCIYCCFRNERLLINEMMYPADEIPEWKMEELIEDMGEMGVRAVTISGGGEPLIYPYIAKAVEKLYAKGIKLGVLSNGSHLCGDLAHLLADKVVWVRISLDAANPTTFSNIRRVDSSEFYKIWENIRRFVEIKGRKSLLGLNFIITKENYSEIYAFLKMAKDAGVDNVKLSAAVVSTEPKQARDYLDPFFALAKEEIAKSQEDLADKNFKIVDKFYLPNGDQESFDNPFPYCPFIQCLTVIGADLNVYTCQDKAYSRFGLLGSIRNQRFLKLWQSEELIKRLKSLNPAKDCRHHCVAHKKNRLLLEYLNLNKDHLEFV